MPDWMILLPIWSITPLMGEGNGTFSWSPAAFVSNPFIANPQIRPDQTYDYIPTVTSPDGCSASDTVTIYVEDITIVDVPNAFSPNDDGVNDLFFVYTHTVADFYEFSIYNRWGSNSLLPMILLSGGMGNTTMNHRMWAPMYMW